MTQTKTLTQAYADAGFRIGNPRNHWSALDKARQAVAITVWEDQIDRTCEPWVFDTIDHRNITLWMDRLGNKIRKRHLRYAINNCEGRVSLIHITAVDPTAEPRRVSQRRYWPERVGVLSEGNFDEETGAFRMELVRV